MFDDDQETPNTLNAAFEFNRERQDQDAGVRKSAIGSANREYPSSAPGGGLGGTIGNLYYGSNGYLVIDNYNKYFSFIGKEQKPGPTATKSDTHFPELLDAVRAHKKEMLNCEIEEGAASTVLVHLATSPTGWAAPSISIPRH